MGGRLRWQAIIALTGVAFVLGTVIYLAYQFTTVFVPDYGGIYREGLVGRPRYINPILAQSDVDRDLASLIFSGLVSFTVEGEAKPDLAESWEILEDGLSYLFYLRQDVRWHDGRPFTADDVVFTVETIQHPDYPGPPHLAQLWRAVKVRKIGRWAVKFTLEEPFAPFLEYMSLGILPEHLLKDIPPSELPRAPFNLQPVGTGPFQIDEVDPNGRFITLKPSPNFPGPRPFLEKIQFKFYPDYESLLNAYREGEIEALGHILPEHLPSVRAEEDLVLFSAPLPRYVLIFLNLRDPLFRDRKVRQALLHALNRQEVVAKALDGQGIVLDSPIFPESWAYHGGLPSCRYDPRRAAELLEEAGWSDGDEDGVLENGELELAFTFLTDEDPQRVRVAEEVARQWGKMGIGVEVQVVSGVALQELLEARNFQAALAEVEPGLDPDPYPFWHETQVDQGQNYAGFRHRKASEAIEEARRTTNQARRKELYQRFQEIFAREVPSIILYRPVYEYAVDSRVRGVQLGFLVRPADRFRTFPGWYVRVKRVILSQAQRRGE